MPTDNELLAGILAAIRALGNTDYIITGSENVVVTVLGVTLRAANPNSLKVVITNTGEHPFLIYEGTKLVAIIYSEESYVSDLAGILPFTAKVQSGSPTSRAAITTYTLT